MPALAIQPVHKVSLVQCYVFVWSITEFYLMSSEIKSL